MAQDDQCFACGRAFRENGYGRIVFHTTALTIDGQQPFVGHDCYKRIVAGGADGWQPPKGGPRLWDQFQAPEEARKAAGITLIWKEKKCPFVGGSIDGAPEICDRCGRPYSEHG